MGQTVFQISRSAFHRCTCRHCSGQQLLGGRHHWCMSRRRWWLKKDKMGSKEQQFEFFCPECTFKHWPQTDSSSRLKNCNNLFHIFYHNVSLLIDQKLRFRFRANSSTVFRRKCSFGGRNIEQSRNSTRRSSGLPAVPTSSPGPVLVSHRAAVKAQCMPRDREVAGSNPAGWCFFHFSIPSVGHP